MSVGFSSWGLDGNGGEDKEAAKKSAIAAWSLWRAATESSSKWLAKDSVSSSTASSWEKSILWASSCFIASPIVKNVFHWKRPLNPAKGYQWYKKRKLIITWDILNQDWRIVNLKNWEIIAAMPVDTVLQKAEFLKFYHCVLETMTRNSDSNGHRRNSFADK